MQRVPATRHRVRRRAHPQNRRGLVRRGGCSKRTVAVFENGPSWVSAFGWLTVPCAHACASGRRLRGRGARVYRRADSWSGRRSYLSMLRPAGEGTDPGSAAFSALQSDNSEAVKSTERGNGAAYARAARTVIRVRCIMGRVPTRRGHRATTTSLPGVVKTGTVIGGRAVRVPAWIMLSNRSIR